MLKWPSNGTCVIAKIGTRFSGGHSFSRGALYALLYNPIYVGEIRHKNLRHPGQHQTIVDRAEWERTAAASGPPSSHQEPRCKPLKESAHRAISRREWRARPRTRQDHRPQVWAPGVRFAPLAHVSINAVVMSKKKSLGGLPATGSRQTGD